MTPPALDLQLLTVAEVAQRLAVSKDWVYRHADELGAVKLGAGSKPRLRFEAERVAEFVHACSTGRRTAPVSDRLARPEPPRKSIQLSGRGAPLLPIRGTQQPGAQTKKAAAVSGANLKGHAP